MSRRSAFALPPVFALQSVFALILLAMAGGCRGVATRDDFRTAAAIRSAATRPLATTGPADVQTLTQFRVAVVPPVGWRLKTTSVDDRHEHVTWVSPSGNTAFGCVFFRLPWAVGHELAFRYGFLAEMERREKSAEVVEKRWDPDIEGLRFIVNSPNYQINAKFLVRGLRGFSVYTGTKRDAPVDLAEVELANVARESAEFAGEIERPAGNADTVSHR